MTQTATSSGDRDRQRADEPAPDDRTGTLVPRVERRRVSARPRTRTRSEDCTDLASAGRAQRALQPPRRWPDMRAKRSCGTSSAASPAIRHDIFERPSSRSRKTIGSSTTVKPAHRAMGQLDLEGVAARADGRQVDRLEHLAAKALQAAGQVVDVEAEHLARVPRAAAADEPPDAAPVRHAAAGHVARAEHEVGLAGGGQQAREVGGIMREVGVHLHDERGAAVQRTVKPAR